MDATINRGDNDAEIGGISFGKFRDVSFRLSLIQGGETFVQLVDESLNCVRRNACRRHSRPPA